MLNRNLLQDDAVNMVEEAEELTDALRTQVLFAREYLKSVTIGPKQVAYFQTGLENCIGTGKMQTFMVGCHTNRAGFKGAENCSCIDLTSSNIGIRRSDSGLCVPLAGTKAGCTIISIVKRPMPGAHTD